MMGELYAFGSDPTAGRSELGAPYGCRPYRAQHQAYGAAWEGGFGLVYATVLEAGEISGEGSAEERLELYLLAAGVASWAAAGDKGPIPAAGIVTARVMRISALLGQQRLELDVWVQSRWSARAVAVVGAPPAGWCQERVQDSGLLPAAPHDRQGSRGTLPVVSSCPNPRHLMHRRAAWQPRSHLRPIRLRRRSPPSTLRS